MTDSARGPLLVLAEFAFSDAGEAAFLPLLDRTLAEVRAIDGCLQAVLWTRPGRRYQFSTLWTDAGALGRWIANEFHQSVLVPGFREWCTEGWFGEYALAAEHPRARRCARCERWTQAPPGWDEGLPRSCARCGSGLRLPETRSGA